MSLITQMMKDLEQRRQVSADDVAPLAPAAPTKLRPTGESPPPLPVAATVGPPSSLRRPPIAAWGVWVGSVGLLVLGLVLARDHLLPWGERAAAAWRAAVAPVVRQAVVVAAVAPAVEPKPAPVPETVEAEIVEVWAEEAVEDCHPLGRSAPQGEEAVATQLVEREPTAEEAAEALRLRESQLLSWTPPLPELTPRRRPLPVPVPVAVAVAKLPNVPVLRQAVERQVAAPVAPAPVVTRPAVALAEVKPVAPVEVKPAAPVEVKPAAPVEVKPAAPVEVKPAAPVEAKPAAPVEVKPAAPATAGGDDPFSFADHPQSAPPAVKKEEPAAAPEEDLGSKPKPARKEVKKEEPPPAPPQKALASALDQAERSYRQALELWRQGEVQAAEKGLWQALSFQGVHKPARRLLARLLHESGRRQQALDLLKEGYRLLHDPLLGRDYARLLVEMDQTEQAIEVAESILKRGRDAEMQAFVAALYQRKGQHWQAIDYYDQLLQREPNEARWWMGLAISLEYVGKVDQAVAAYQRALALGQQGLSRQVLEFLRERLRALSG